MELGVLGGTFDPIHNGHLAIAETARAQMNLTEVLFVPAGQPWLKENRAITAAEHRLSMVRLAIADRPSFKLSTIETERAGPSYTVDTIAQLRAELGDQDKLFFILGWDSLAQLPEWYQPARLVKMCQLVAIPRASSPPPDLDRLNRAVPGLGPQVIRLDEPWINISASQIKQRVARGLPIDRLVPAPVDQYIKQHRLYRG